MFDNKAWAECSNSVAPNFCLSAKSDLGTTQGGRGIERLASDKARMPGSYASGACRGCNWSLGNRRSIKYLRSGTWPVFTNDSASSHIWILVSEGISICSSMLKLSNFGIASHRYSGGDRDGYDRLKHESILTAPHNTAVMGTTQHRSHDSCNSRCKTSLSLVITNPARAALS